MSRNERISGILDGLLAIAVVIMMMVAAVLWLSTLPHGRTMMCVVLFAGGGAIGTIARDIWRQRGD